MDSDGAGPSNIKKRKLTFKNPKKLTEDELLAALEASSDEFDEYDDFTLEDSEWELNIIYVTFQLFF